MQTEHEEEMKEAARARKQEMLFEFGSFGILAMKVAQTGFRLSRIKEELSALLAVRLKGDDRARLQAFAAVAQCSLSRMSAEMIAAGLDELEAELLKENPQQFENYMNLYQAICEQAIEARDSL